MYSVESDASGYDDDDDDSGGGGDDRDSGSDRLFVLFYNEV